MVRGTGIVTISVGCFAPTYSEVNLVHTALQAMTMASTREHLMHPAAKRPNLQWTMINSSLEVQPAIRRIFRGAM